MRLGDAQSRNGTFVNGKRIDSVLLAHGDVIRAGDSLLLFLEQEPGGGSNIQSLARSSLSVLLRGETGTGKEKSRRAGSTPRAGGSFVVLNCGCATARS